MPAPGGARPPEARGPRVASALAGGAQVSRGLLELAQRGRQEPQRVGDWWSRGGHAREAVAIGMRCQLAVHELGTSAIARPGGDASRGREHGEPYEVLVRIGEVVRCEQLELFACSADLA